jgi:hypothetical protein
VNYPAIPLPQLRRQATLRSLGTNAGPVSGLPDAAIFLAIIIFTWPTPPWDQLLYGAVALMLIIPALLYPFAKTLFLAFDLTFRPPTPEDFE